MQLDNQSAGLANPELFSAFLENMPAAVAMLDRNLCYLLTSRRWLSDYALEHHNVIGRSHYEVFPMFQNEATKSVSDGDRASTTETTAHQTDGGNPSNPIISRQIDEISATSVSSSFIPHSTPVLDMALPHHPFAMSSSPQSLNQWQEIYASCLAGETRHGNSTDFISSDGSRQRIKWEIQPWHTDTGEIGGIMMFTQFLDDYPLVGDSRPEHEQNCCHLQEATTTRLWGTVSSTPTIEQLQQEIIQRQQAQSSLEESEERYRSLIGAMAEGILLKDATGVVRTCNAAAEQMLGLSLSQLMGLAPIHPNWQAITEDGQPFPYEEQPINLTLRTGQSLTDIVMGIHKPDGSLTWLRVNSKPLFHPTETTPYAAVASFTDITNRKRMEEELRESEERFRATFEQAAVGINHATLDGRFIRVNQKFCDITGYSREELLERTFHDITHPEDLPIDLERVRSLLAGERDTYSREKRFIRKDGQSIWVQITASLIRNSQSSPKYFLRVVQDISTRKATEARLREQVQRETLLNRLSTQIRNSLELPTILETTAQAIRETLQTDRCQFSWYHPEDPQPYWDFVEESRNSDLPSLIGRYPAQLLRPIAEQFFRLEPLRIEDAETISEPTFKQFIHSLGFTSALMLPMRTPSGTTGIIMCSHVHKIRVWTDSEVALVKAVTGQLFIAIKQADLYAESRQATQQAQELAAQREQALYELQYAQAQLIQSEKMSSLGQLVAGVAHEINNPVNFIYGNLVYAQQYFQDLLSLVQLYRDSYPSPPQVIRQRIDAIDLDFMVTDLTQLQDSMKSGAERIREIVRSLRTFSRVDEAASKAVDIHDGIESSLMILQSRLKAQAGHCAITVIKEYGALPLVECYPGQLNQVFLNLLTNAIDALEDQQKSPLSEVTEHEPEAGTYSPPTITITTGLVSQDNSDSTNVESSPQVFIRIADNGPGIAQKTLQRLFDPFFTTKPVGKGTGLGLAISYQIIVERHGGQLRCNSTPGQGAEFVIEIPLQQVKKD
ncbi:MAG TPA: PAS domain S-box protein [Coleofasciculaceae cyanobacterium]